MACSQIKAVERKEHVGITEKQFAIHSCSWADRDPTAAWLFCRLAHCTVIVPDSMGEPAALQRLS